MGNAVGWAVLAFLWRFAALRARSPTAWSGRCEQKQKCGNRRHAPADPILLLPHPASSQDRSAGDREFLSEDTLASVLTLNCRATIHAAAACPRAARARLILARMAAPSARQTYGFGSALRSAR